MSKHIKKKEELYNNVWSEEMKLMESDFIYALSIYAGIHNVGFRTSGRWIYVNV
jgi:hypothetical protein